MKIIKSFFYRLGGADYDVLKDCSKRTKFRHLNLAFALLLTVTCAAIGGYDIASQFTESKEIKAGVAVLWAIATLSFDYFLINGGAARGIFKYIRIAVGLANICITITALFIMLNQAGINSRITLNNGDSLKAVDDKYLKAKENRYQAVNAKKAEAEKYNNDVVIPEARNGYPGPKYGEKKTAYDVMIVAVNEETAKLDALEQPYLKAYQTERSALESIQSNDFFTKVALLPEVMQRGGPLSLFLSVCLFIFLSYIELQAIALKLSIAGDNDEYHRAEKDHEERTREIRNVAAESGVELERRKILLNSSVKDSELRKEEYSVLMNDLDDRIVREAEMRGRIEILRAKGYDVNADNLEAELDRFIKTSPKSQRTATKTDGKQDDSSENGIPSEEILKCTQPMKATLEALQNSSTGENPAEDIFKWIVINIIYDKCHGRFFYRTARETYNDGHGICGELSVLYIAFLRACGIDATFVEVTKDHLGEEVTHACVLIKQNGSQFLSDPAYNRFIIEHREWNAWNDEKLSAEYRSWNI